MGTNYYLVVDPCAHCNRGDEKRHIGKSSGGWAFALHVEPYAGIRDLDDWIKLFNDPKNKIFDEYNRPLTKDEMLDVIKNRSGDAGKKVPFGYDSLEEFLIRNYACLDTQFGLMRANPRLTETRCIGWGKGPWDLINSEFS